MSLTCERCLNGQHRICRGCACTMCGAKKVRSTPRQRVRTRPAGNRGPRHGSQGQNNPNPGNFTAPLPVNRLLGVLESIRVYQRTGILPSQQEGMTYERLA